ncbi:hypothetical protein DIURU_002535 [Diutina rugosa]|uniref:Zn(2)-C6 fungal-type domain-containing protein n=1 Tax=Diutina rugosa TaxID=5481 RepID=A0A642UWG9_DIURU|nr:uncharacterized protein DIURU_002535 [Diutina rugosa]KAA8903248.1 hypothetical protein DIURU_002535 [Diutina rugosa]
MPRAKVRRCGNCKRLKIKCVYPDDEPPPPATYGPHEYESSALTSKQNSPTFIFTGFDTRQRFGSFGPFTPFEERLLETLDRTTLAYYANSRDPAHLYAVFEMVPELFGMSELMKRSMYAYSSMLLIAESHPKLLLGDSSDATEGVLQLHRFGFANYNLQVSQISLLMTRLSSGEITNQEVTILIAATMFLMSIVGSGTSEQMPLVNFTTGKGDFLTLLRGVRETHRMAQAYAYVPMFDLYHKDTYTHPVPMLPLFRQYNELYIHHMQIDEFEFDAEQVEFMTGVLKLINRSVYLSAHDNDDLEFFRVFARGEPDWFDLVYDLNMMGLNCLFIMAAYCLGFNYYFVRHDNMWISYMRWYKTYCFAQYGGWYFTSDEPLYSLMVDKHYVFADMDQLVAFDPVHLDMVTPYRPGNAPAAGNCSAAIDAFS